MFELGFHATLITLFVALFALYLVIGSSSKVKNKRDQQFEGQLQDRTTEMASGEVAALFIHPLKSARPIAVTTMEFDDLGAKYDRRWFLVDQDNNARNAKMYPKLLLLKQSLETDSLLFDYEGSVPLRVPLSRRISASDNIQEIALFGVKGGAIEEGNEASEWMNRYLGLKSNTLRLMRCVETQPRKVIDLISDYGVTDKVLIRENDPMGFTDQTSLLVLSEESIADLNNKIQSKNPGVTVGVEDFRPNILLKGFDQPYAEDTLKEYRINDTLFRGLIPCIRCKVTTVEKDKNVYRKSGEPLETLRSYRGLFGRTCFGQCTQHQTKSDGGSISVGDRVFVRQHKEFPHPFELKDIKSVSQN